MNRLLAVIPLAIVLVAMPAQAEHYWGWHGEQQYDADGGRRDANGNHEDDRDDGVSNWRDWGWHGADNQRDRDAGHGY